MTDFRVERERVPVPSSDRVRASQALDEVLPAPTPPDPTRPFLTIALSSVIVAVVVVSATIGGRSLAFHIAGMSSLEFHRDLIVATSSIAIHLTFDRFIHRVSDLARSRRPGSSKRDWTLEN